MNTLIVLAHPERQSFNANLAKLAQDTFSQNGHKVKTSDLYELNFDPRESQKHFSIRQNSERFDAQAEQRFNWGNKSLPQDVQDEIDKILWADLVILQFPLWWFGLPGILKGWIDRVFVYGGLYSGARRHDKGVCRGKKVLACVTAGSSELACAPDGREGDTQLILWPTFYAFRYVGFTVIQPFMVYGVRGGLEAEEAERQTQYLLNKEQEYKRLLLNIDAAPIISFNSDEDWDKDGKLKPCAPVYSPFIRHKV